MGMRSTTVVLASSARTTLQEELIDVPAEARGVTFIVDATVDPSTASITPSIDGYSSPTDTDWNLLTGAAIASVSTVALSVGPGITASANVAAAAPLPDRIKFKMAVADAESMTYSVTAEWW